MAKSEDVSCVIVTLPGTQNLTDITQEVLESITKKALERGRVLEGDLHLKELPEGVPELGEGIPAWEFRSATRKPEVLLG
jgi:hypothetical protein